MGSPRGHAGWLAALLLLGSAAGATAQSTRTVTDETLGFKVRMPRYLQPVPTKPDEEQIIGKYKGTKRVKAPRHKDRKGDWVKHVDLPLEIWVVRIANPKSDAAPVTGGGNQVAEKDTPPEKLADQLRRAKNSGRTLEEFLDRRLRGVAEQLRKVPFRRPIKSRDGEPYLVQSTPSDTRSFAPFQVQTFTVEHDHEDYGRELFGLVASGYRLAEFEQDVTAAARSLQRLGKKRQTYEKADPYEGSALRDLPRRREVRSRLIDGWYAEDTENFILVTDMTNNASNRALLRDMLIDLEVMRTAYEKRFPPIAPLSVVSTVRVCNSYDGYLRYSSKPGTGGYWHPLNEELVLFNPVGKIRKQAWMKKVTPKAILYHEAMHQYFHYSNGEMPPASWFNEGYGEYFGGCKTDRFEKTIRVIEKNEFRWQLVKDARKDGRWPELKRLLKMTQQQFYSQKGEEYSVLSNYAFGWAFCYFLEEERGKPQGKRNEEWASIPDRYLVNLRAATDEARKSLPANAPKGALFGLVLAVQKKAFEATFGKTDFAPLQAAWVKAMKSW